ncbi:MAG: putrescine ABC transporter permease PotH, partial [Rhizobiaceae bacterium]|nr:putrescine ABC transporter permease PotH [Rhizobiaceae bacterium]
MSAAAPEGWTARQLAKLGLNGRWGRWLVIAVPSIWLLIFFLAPFLVVLKIAFSEAAIARPPYTPLITWEEGRLFLTLNFGNFQYLWEDSLYLFAYLSSIKIAFFSTVFALLIGYPMAYFIARSDDKIRNILLMLVILPFWTSFLLRVYAWIGFLKGNGLINNFLIWLGVIDDPIVMMQTDFGVYVGIVYTYLPFMILPLYANLVKL